MSNNKPVVYVAGVFSKGDTLPKEEQEKNRNLLRYYSLIFMKKGYAVISPIENDQWAYDLGLVTYDDVIETDLAVIAKCDYIFLVPGWEKGHGTVIEHKFAEENDIPIWYKIPKYNGDQASKHIGKERLKGMYKEFGDDAEVTHHYSEEQVPVWPKGHW